MQDSSRIYSWFIPYINFNIRYLKTTAGNIKLITKFRTKEYDVSQDKDERLFAFWMEFFIDATNEEYSSTQFPVSCIVNGTCCCCLIEHYPPLITGRAALYSSNLPYHYSILSSCF